MNYKQVGYIGIDQCGQTFYMEKYPRKELLEQLGATKASKMYVDLRNGKSREKGYIIKGHWIDVYRVCQWKQ